MMRKTWDEWLDEVARLLVGAPAVLDLADHEMLQPYYAAGVEPVDLVRHALATIDGLPGDAGSAANLYTNRAHQIWRQAELKAGRLP
jgi:hypothetical protein